MMFLLVQNFKFIIMAGPLPQSPPYCIKNASTVAQKEQTLALAFCVFPRIHEWGSNQVLYSLEWKANNSRDLSTKI